MFAMRNQSKPGFTLMETVIAIGVLAVLITAFLAVFGPATQGIRRAINVQDADRLVATLEKEMGILRPGESGGGTWNTAFDKAFDWIRDAGKDELIMLYQYRGDPDNIRPRRHDGAVHRQRRDRRAGLRGAVDGPPAQRPAVSSRTSTGWSAGCSACGPASWSTAATAWSREPRGRSAG